MNEQQLNQINSIRNQEKTVHINELVENHARTLLFGYTIERDTFHVYVRNQQLHKVIYKQDEIIHYTSGDYLNLEGIIPNKRLYPEACDYNFCKILSKAGVDLPFTTFDSTREHKLFHGKVIQPTGKLSAWESKLDFQEKNIK